ncbi:MAG: hypothetical protein IIB81_01150 [Nanoarchaeota archaeon]|nr:hypothetical protein [Nanoarchaeota archaeon]
MKLAEEAFTTLFPEKDLENYELKIKYTGKFKPYNANVRYSRNSFQFNLSRKWKTVSREIQMGLIQGLMLKIFRENKKTMNIDLYNSFMKNLHISIPKVNNDLVLEESGGTFYFDLWFQYPGWDCVSTNPPSIALSWKSGTSANCDHNNTSQIIITW